MIETASRGDVGATADAKVAGATEAHIVDVLAGASRAPVGDEILGKRGCRTVCIEQIGDEDGSVGSVLHGGEPSRAARQN